jgi:hypothetical protein
VTPPVIKDKTYVVRAWDDGVLMTPIAFAATAFAGRFLPGDRVFLQGWYGGAPTGRARIIRRLIGEGWSGTWAWSRGAEDPEKALAGLSLRSEPDVFPVIGLADTR